MKFVGGRAKDEPVIADGGKLGSEFGSSAETRGLPWSRGCLGFLLALSPMKEVNSGPRVAGGNVLAEVSLPSTTFSSEARPERAAESLVRAEVATSSSLVFLFEQLLELLVPERDEAPVSRCRHHRFSHGRGDCLGCG